MISFRPKPGSSYRTPGTAEKRFQGMRYFLLIPAFEGSTGGVPVAISVAAVRR
jgi:hypothetical protein